MLVNAMNAKAVNMCAGACYACVQGEGGSAV